MQYRKDFNINYLGKLTHMKLKIDYCDHFQKNEEENMIEYLSMERRAYLSKIAQLR